MARHREVTPPTKLLPSVGKVLWAVAVGSFLVGDSVTTALGVNAGLYEANPFVRDLLDQVGLWGWSLLKMLPLAIMWYCYVEVRRNDSDDTLVYAIPLILAVIGSVATLHNLSLLV